ncbi:MAG: SAF domain-containing protein [Jatrophihabitans sp.]
MTAPSPEPRRIATPSWLDLRLVLGIVLVLASVLIGATVVSRASDTHASVTATRDLEAGTILTAADVRVTQVQLPDNGKGVYLDRIEGAIGKSLDRRVSKGELVPSAAVDEVAARTTVTLPLTSGAAPRLHDGQRIEVWVSTKSCAAVVLLPDVTVQDVRSDSEGSFGAGSGGQDVVISVAPALSDRVVAALAIEGAQIRAGVLVGGRPIETPSLGAPSPTPSVTPPPTGAPSDPPVPSNSAGRLPADLAACASPTAGR